MHVKHPDPDSDLRQALGDQSSNSAASIPHEPDTALDFDGLAATLERCGCEPIDADGVVTCRCPACHSRNHVLTLDRSQDVPSLHCAVGCSSDAVIDALVELVRTNGKLSEVKRLIRVGVRDLLAMEVPPREPLLEPILLEADLGMIYGWRGTGKSFMAWGIGVAVASGSTFLKWKAPKAQRVLVVDGELPLHRLQRWVATSVAAAGADPGNNLQVITPDLQNAVRAPNIAERAGQQLVEDHLDGVKLLVLDNLSTLCSGGEENLAESWQVVQDWILSLRRLGVAVLMIHHSGKNGGQRGTSKREDTLDTVIALKRPGDYKMMDGLRLEWHWEKARELFGPDAAPFEVKLDQAASGNPIWTMSEMEDAIRDQIISLTREGLSMREVGEKVHRDKSRVSRILKKAREDGLYVPE